MTGPTGEDRRADVRTRTQTASLPWWRRRHWSIGAVVVVLVLVGAAYQYLSAGPGAKQYGPCAVVPHASPTHVTDCDGMDLSGMDLSGVDLRMAKLKGADLQGADLRGAIMYGADLREANLRDTDFSSADLTSADLTGATLGNTDFTKTGITSMIVNDTLLSADNRSVWSADSDPRLLTLRSRDQPGIVTNDCRNREGLYYPGAVTVTCTLTTEATYDNTLSYSRYVEVKLSPTIEAPSRIDLAVGQSARTSMRADSPYPAVQTNFHGDLPRGVRWDAATQHLLGVPREGSEGTYHVTFAADNGHHVEKDITIVVRGSAS